jgi:hypothetical protein
MFFSQNERSVRRGKRISKRTETCRPCIVRGAGAEPFEEHGVVLDVTPRGMLIRMMRPAPVGTEITVQLMRDENFREPLAEPVAGTVVRHAGTAGAFVDHGVKLKVERIQRKEPAIPPMRTPPPPVRRRAGKMHTIDFTVGDVVRRRGRP